MDMDTLRKSIDVIYDQLHMLAEPSGREIRTAEFVASHLRAYGYEIAENIGGHGVVGALAGAFKNPCVAFLANMDALVFTVDGKRDTIHACGHDANCAMLLGAAEMLAGRQWPGTIKIIFQPSEENFLGATAMIRDGVGSDIDFLAALHLRPIQEARLFQATPALLHGASGRLEVRIYGKSAHAARPHLGCNAIEPAVALVNAINAMHMDPVHSYSIKATSFHAGENNSNIIPAEAVLSIDVRASLEDDMVKITQMIENAATMIANAYGATAEVITRSYAPAAEIDPELQHLAQQAICDVLGAENLLPPIRTSGGDDFHFFSRAWPNLKAVYLGLGADLSPGLHAPDMVFERKVLASGAQLLAHLAELIMRKYA